MPNPCARAQDQLGSQCIALAGLGLPRNDHVGTQQRSGVFVCGSQLVIIIVSLRWCSPGAAALSYHSIGLESNGRSNFNVKKTTRCEKLFDKSGSQHSTPRILWALTAETTRSSAAAL